MYLFHAYLRLGETNMLYVQIKLEERFEVFLVRMIVILESLPEVSSFAA